MIGKAFFVIISYYIFMQNCLNVHIYFLKRQTFLMHGTVLSSSRGIILWLSDFEAQINPTEELSSPDRTAPIPSTLPGRLSQLDCMSNLHIIWTT